MTRLMLSRLPIFACVAFILCLFLINIWNFAVERDWPKLRIRSASPLAGVMKPKPAPWTLEAFLAGETQKAVSTNIGRALPVFPISVRARNQIVFSLFNDSAASGVVIGRNNQLYEQFYIDEFCSRGRAADMGRIAAWSMEIGEIQGAASKAGKRFVYLISPSKAARYSEDLPQDANCAKRVAQSDKLAPYRDALSRRGVTFVDGASLISRERPNFPISLFPVGGTHWNSLGGALALREIARAIEPSPLGPIEFNWTRAPEAIGTDRDLVELLNLLWPDLSYPTASVTRAGGASSCATSPRLLAMGGSFLHEVLAAAATLAPCPPQIDYWFYMRAADNTVELGHFRRAPGDDSNGERLVASPEALKENLRDADIVLLEENESNIAQMKQVGDLLAAASK